MRKPEWEQLSKGLAVPVDRNGAENTQLIPCTLAELWLATLNYTDPLPSIGSIV